VKRLIISTTFAAGLIISSVSALQQRDSGAPPSVGHLGFDRNEYPGDDNLSVLRRTFEFAGYWLNNPPGATSNSWTGKRKVVQAAGFGFMVIFNGRTYAQIKAAGNATNLGSSDAVEAVKAARREGFPPRTIIFIDQEQARWKASSRATSLSSCLGRRREIVGGWSWRVLLRDRCQRSGRGSGYYRRRYSKKCW
jgi:hypothetical protein